MMEGKKEEEEEIPTKEAETTTTAAVTSETKKDNDDDKIEKTIMAFLQHPSIASLPTSMKISYLENKGLSSHHIQQAMNNSSSTTTTTTVVSQPQAPQSTTTTPYHQYHHSPQQEYNHPNNNGPSSTVYSNHNSMMVPPEPPNAMIPITFGAVLALFGMASYRWLIHGDDFILFPTAPTISTTSEGNLIQPPQDIVEEEEEDPILEVQEQQAVVEEDELCLELKGLHQTIQNYVRQEQEKERTNRTMDLLVRQKSSDTKEENKQQQTLQMQLMEIKYLFHQLLSLQQQTQKTNDEETQTTILLQQIQQSLQTIQDQIIPSNETTTTTTTKNTPATIPTTTTTTTSIANDSKPLSKPVIQETENKPEKNDEDTVTPPSMDKVSFALKEFMECNQDSSLDLKKSAAQMLYLYIYNLATHPNTPRYQKIFTNNSTFVNKVQNVPGAVSILTSVGFQQTTKNYLEYPTSILQDAIPLLQDTATSLSFIKNGNHNSDEKQDKHALASTTTTNVVETGQQCSDIAPEQQDNKK